MVAFLSKEIGDNPRFSHKIEESESAPGLSTSLTLSTDGRFLVMTLQCTASGGFPAVSTVIDGIDGNFTRPSRVQIRNNSHQCDGFYVFKVQYQTGTTFVSTPPSGVSAQQAAKMKWTKQESPVFETGYVVGCLSNLVRSTGHAQNKEYSLMATAKAKNQQQVHVEQIAAFQIEALLTYLAGLRGPNNTRLFEPEKFDVSGHVYFDGVGDDKKPLQNACNACVGVWDRLFQRNNRIHNVTLLQN